MTVKKGKSPKPAKPKNATPRQTPGGRGQIVPPVRKWKMTGPATDTDNYWIPAPTPKNASRKTKRSR